MEQTRMHVVQSIARARLVQFDGQPVAPWTTGQGQSLPPPPDKPKKSGKKIKATTAEAEARAVQMRELLAQGLSTKAIADALGFSDCQTVYSIKSKLKRAGLLVASETEVQQLVPATARQPVVTPVRLPRAQEPQRTHVLDWAARLARMEFDGEPGAGKPVRAKSRSKCSRADFRSVYPCPYVSAPARINPVRAINCVAPARRSPFD